MSLTDDHAAKLALGAALTPYLVPVEQAERPGRPFGRSAAATLTASQGISGRCT